MQIKSQAAEAHSRIEPGLSHKKYYHPCICSSGGSRIWRGEVRLFPSPPLPFPSLPSPPFPSHSPPLHYPSPPFPFLSLPHPYPFPPSPPLRSRTPWLRLGGRQTLSGAFSAYLGAFWQAFSSNLSLVKLQLLTPPQFFKIFPFRNVMLRPRLTLSPPPIPHLTLPSPF